MIIVTGNPSFIPEAEFKPKLDRCIKLLKDKAGQYHTWVSWFGLTIRPAAKSGANFGDNAIDIARDTFNASDTWLASVIVHETIHIWQYKTGHYQAGTVAEQEANKYQLGVLQLVGAPQSEITYMMSQDGHHADLNGDGVYDEKDYAARTY